MGRLFWKLFAIIWLTQIASVIGVGTAIWLKHRTEPDWRFGPPRDGLPPGMHPPPPGRPHGPGGPHGRGPLDFPLEPIAVGMLVSLVTAALLARYLSKPIRLLRSGFDAASRGDLDRRLAPELGGRRDELADLGREFDRVAGRLKTLMDGQRRLLHDVSHELRSPLARLQAAVGLARQQPESLADWLNRIDLEAERMDRLVGELLTLSRLEAGVPAGKEERFDLSELLITVVEDARFEAETLGRQVSLASDPGTFILGQPELLQRAIENVIRNAVRHTGEGTAVEVASKAEGGWLRVRVSDRGSGVPEAELEAIFQPFRRGSQARQGDGHGLGLAIARRVVEAHGGRVSAANRPGGGLVVTLELPSSP